MTDLPANLSFLPWVRQGVAGAIPTKDTFAAVLPGVATLQIGLSLNGATSTPVTASLRGPADVIGLDEKQVVRMEPRPSSTDFEPNHFSSIEFDRADLPWLFTPLAPGTQSRLRPWICLVTIRVQPGVSLGPAVTGPLPQLQIAAPANPADELPALSESWAWAHAQAASGDSSQTAIAAALAGAPELSLSRLIGPRRLVPETDYIACVVPTFEIGRKAGLGLPIAAAELNALAPAWLANASAPITLPVYHHWRFRTGAGGDFASLAQRLTARPAPAGLGQRPVDIARPGFALPSPFPAATILNLGGALEAVDTPETDPPWPAGTQAPFQTALSKIIDRPDQSATNDPNADPLLAPPLYGRWYAARAAATPGAANWFDTLNLDPRWRSIAAFGVRVVQENQEALMASAWQQAAELRQANQRVRQLQLSLTVGSNLHTRHFGALSADAVLRVGAPAFGRIRAATNSDPRPRTLIGRLSDSVVPVAAASPAMRRIARARGPATRRAIAQTITRLTAVPAATGSATSAPTGAVIRSGTATIVSTATISGTIASGAIVTGSGLSVASSGSATTVTGIAGPVRSVGRNWLDGLNLVLSATPAAPPAGGLATFAAVIARMSGTPALRSFAQVTADLVAATGPQPLFTVVAEGQPVRVSHPPPMRPPIRDSAAAAAFRQAARSHLARIDPGRTIVPKKPLVPLDTGDFRATVLKGLDPRSTVPALARAIISVGAGATAPVGTAASAAVGVDTVMMAPSFPQPMYAPLARLSQDLLLPGLETVPPDSVIGLKTNRRFVEAYMIGLNGEMAGELLWRGFPTDQRGTYFRQFWDTRGTAKPHPDIDPPIGWGGKALGQAATGRTGSDAEQFVALIRGALLQRYPNATIYAVRAVKSAGFRSPSPAPQDEIYPIFSANLQPDLYFFGFPLAAGAVTGADGSDGYYIVIQEHPTEPRFGFNANAPMTTPSVSVAAGAPAGIPLSGFQWGRNAAHMAGITRRLPVRVAIHGSRFATVTGSARP